MNQFRKKKKKEKKKPKSEGKKKQTNKEKTFSSRRCKKPRKNAIVLVYMERKKRPITIFKKLTICTHLHLFSLTAHWPGDR